MFRRKNKYKAKIILCIFILLIIGSYLFFNIKSTPIISTLALSNAINRANVVINNTVDEMLKNNTFNYNELVSIEYDASGGISAVKADSINMNLIKTRVSVEIAKAVSEIEEITISLPLGTLLGGTFLTGHGPEIKLNVSLSCSCEIEILNSFQYSGINQTLHKITLDIKTYVYVISLGDKKSAEVSTSIPIAQTVIIGKIPEIYAGKDDSLWENLID